MPNNKMERFTQRARRVLSLAQEEAEKLHHNTIGTEHMLLGLLREESGIAGRVLRDLGLEQQRVEEMVEELTRANARPDAISAELAPDFKRVLELAVDEARRMGHHYIGTEHMLLGLVRQSEGVAIDVLKRHGVSPEEVRRQTRRVLQEAPVQTPAHRDSVTQMGAEPAAAVPILPQAAPRLTADAYELLENVLMKILEMIESGKLPLAQGVELFSTLTPDLKLVPGQQAELVSNLFDLKKFGDYHVHLFSVDSKGVKTIGETKLPLTTLLSEIDQFLSGVLNDPAVPLTFHLGDSRLEVRIEKGAEPGEQE